VVAPVIKGGAGFRRKKSFIGAYRPAFSLWFLRLVRPGRPDASAS
jgi:hypothetical protein